MKNDKNNPAGDNSQFDFDVNVDNGSDIIAKVDHDHKGEENVSLTLDSKSV